MAKCWSVLKDKEFADLQLNSLKNELNVSKTKLINGASDELYIVDIEEAYRGMFDLINEVEVLIQQSKFDDVVKKIDVMVYYARDSLMSHPDNIMIVGALLSKLKSIRA